MGFGIETKPNSVRGTWQRTALLAIGNCLLWNQRKVSNDNVDPLLPIFTDPNIIKTGVSIHGDVRELQKVQHFNPAGFVDTTTITQKVLRIKNGGLQALAFHFLGGRITKGAQMSNWAADTLTDTQIRYAATDAWVSRNVHARAAAAAVEMAS